MYQIDTNRHCFQQKHGRLRHFLFFSVLALSFAFTLFPVTSVQAAETPGGNIKDPVVNAVNLAKPAVVRIVTTVEGRLTVEFSSINQQTFPRNSSSYDISSSGSGAFISSNGDILTASHVINVSDEDADLDAALYAEAAQDVATYINTNLPQSTVWTENDAYSALLFGSLPSSSSYDEPTIKVYLSTNYTGPLDSNSLERMPEGTYAMVDEVKKDSPFDEKDTAIIHVPLQDTPSIQLGDATHVAPLDQLTIIGFPGNGDVSFKNKPTTFLTSSVSRIDVSAIKTDDNDAPLIQVSGNIENGTSGGPALDETGRIVGIVSFGLIHSEPQGTAFLQSGQSAQELVDELQLDTKPGTFQTLWSEAYADYISTATGHWRDAQANFERLQNDYPGFKAVEPYLTYTQEQAKNEPVENTGPDNTQIFIYAGLGLIVIIAVILGIYFLRRRQPAIPAGAPYQQFPPSGAYPPPQAVMPPARPNQESWPQYAAVPSAAPVLAGNNDQHAAFEQREQAPLSPWAPEQPNRPTVITPQEDYARSAPPSITPQEQTMIATPPIPVTPQEQTVRVMPPASVPPPATPWPVEVHRTSTPPLQETPRQAAPVASTVSPINRMGNEYKVDSQPAAPISRLEQAAIAAEAQPIRPRIQDQLATPPYTPAPRPQPVQATVKPNLSRWHTDSNMPIPPSMSQPLENLRQTTENSEATEDESNNTDKLRATNRANQSKPEERTIMGQQSITPWPAPNQQPGNPKQQDKLPPQW